jgi:lysophospholipase L1-like esterase
MSLLRMHRVAAIAVAVAATLATLAVPAAVLPAPAASAQTAPARPRQVAPKPAPARPPGTVPHTRAGRVKARPARAVTRAVPAGDEIITASSDTGGYHLFAASSGGGWRWQPLATLQPAGYDGQRWIGTQCLTGDGRYVVAVVAPWDAQNSGAGMAAGGTAYVIDAHTGHVRPLAAGVAVTYFNPGCGVAGSAVLTRYPAADESRTQILLANLAQATVRTLPAIGGELTSAIPAGPAGVLAARGGELVSVSRAGARPVATLPGQVFSLRPNAYGGADFLATAAASRSPAATAYSWRPSGAPRLLTLGHGNVHDMRLYGGAAGHNMLVGGGSAPAGAAAAVGRVAGNGASSRALSLRGGVVLRGAATLTRPADGTAMAGTTAKLPAPAAAPDDAPPATPVCAVPRLSEAYQVPQPTSARIEWASQLAGSGRLAGAGGTDLRPAGFDNLTGGGYSPSYDFRLPAPFGPAGQFVPKEILDGIMAQESNWDQASPHAPQGVPGDPYVADYYGYNATGTIDYSQSDCGYGLGQVTDGMRLATGQTTPTVLQQRVAVDYAENVAAAAQILATKWNQLDGDGITVDTADPSVIEDWYFAVWAYNSGVNPQASTGGGDCTPGPSCTDSAGNWGLGWTNNPANPVYDPGRNPFLHLCLPGADPGTQVCSKQFQDAASPQGWPYQEKVFGWIETPQNEPDGVTPRWPGTFDYTTQVGDFLAQPGHDQMCDSSDDCDYAQAQPCAHNASTDPLQWHCWWHEPVTGVCTADPDQPCHPGHTAASLSAEPGATDPFPGTCSNALPADTVLIDDGSVGDTTTGLNLGGCPQESQSTGGSFTWDPNFDSNLQPTGVVDLHQLGTGYGGHLLFTHLEDASDSAFGGTAEWDLSADYDVFDVSVFVPGLGAEGTLSYYIYNSRGQQVGGPVPVDQDNYDNQWVYLGRYYLGPGSKVTTTNVVPDGDGTTDVAFDAMAFTPVASYAALGDSYSSGVGTGNYDPDSNVPGGDQCLRSPESYARQFGEGNGYPDVLTVHLACSGAVIDDLTTDSNYGEPPQIDAIPRHASLVTVTIGGNDAGFGPVLQHCLTPGNGCEADYTQNNAANEDVIINGLEPRLESVFSAIRARVPAARIIALTYPSIFEPTAVGPSCLFGTGLGLSAQDIEWLISETDNLDNQIERAAQQAGISSLDERYAFADHEVCTGDPWVNGALSGPPEAFHPTADGYTQEATDLAAAVASPALLVPPHNTLRDPQFGTPNGPTARRLLALFPAGQATYSQAAANAYTRSQFNQNGGTTQWESWPVFGGCQTRVLVLHRDDDAATPPASPCDLTGAFWNTPYDQPAITVTDPSTPADHVVALKDAYANGAYLWTQSQRVDFANDFRGPELLTVSSTTNSSKMDSSIEEWQPPNPGYLCAYAEMWVAVKYQWNLGIDGVTILGHATTDEWDFLNNALRGCP